MVARVIFFRLILIITASLVLYFAVFNFALYRPITRGLIFEMLDMKVEHAEQTSAPQLILFAGSNARLSHSCVVLADELELPCTNMGVAGGVGLDTQFAALRRVTVAGDYIYMPLEYSQYVVSMRDMMDSAETGEWFRRDSAGLLDTRGAEGLLRAFFHFDLSYALQSIFEMVFHSAGHFRRSGLHKLNEHGDETGHTLNTSGPYREALRTQPWSPPILDHLKTAPNPGAPQLIAEFIEDMRSRNILVIGGLPTTFDDMPIPEELLEDLDALFTSNGGAFISLDNLSQYPRARFFDTHYHLSEEWAIEHSKSVAKALSLLIDEEGNVAGHSD